MMQSMTKKHYYIYKGYKWFYPCTDYKVFHEAGGIVIKCYTEAEFKRLHQDPNVIWERVEEQGENT